MARMLLRDWDGLRVRLRGDLSTKNGAKATRGAIGRIHTSGTRARFEVDPCPHCGLSFTCIRLSKDDLPMLFEIVKEEPSNG